MEEKKLKIIFYSILITFFLAAFFSPAIYGFIMNLNCNEEINDLFGKPMCFNEEIIFEGEKLKISAIQVHMTNLPSYSLILINENSKIEILTIGENEYEMAYFENKNHINKFDSLKWYDKKFELLLKIKDEKLFEDRILNSIDRNYYNYYYRKDMTKEKCLAETEIKHFQDICLNILEYN